MTRREWLLGYSGRRLPRWCVTAWTKAAKPSLPPGRYLVKVHLDQGGRLAKDWQVVLGDDDYASQVEIESD